MHTHYQVTLQLVGDESATPIPLVFWDACTMLATLLTQVSLTIIVIQVYYKCTALSMLLCAQCSIMYTVQVYSIPSLHCRGDCLFIQGDRLFVERPYAKPSSTGRCFLEYAPGTILYLAPYTPEEVGST